MNKKLIILLTMTITLLSISFFVIYAWFYYPSRVTTLSSSDSLDIETHLYEIDINENKVEAQSASNSSYSLNCNYSFFQWGDEYIIEDDSPRYYAFESILDDDTYISGRFRSIIEFSLKCYSGSSDGTNAGLTYTYNNETIPLRFDIAKVSYAFADNQIDLTDVSSTISSVTSTSFTELNLENEEDDDYTADYYELTSSVNTLFTDESAPSFKYDNDTKIRLVYFIKVEPNTEKVNSYMNSDTSEEIIDALGSELYIYLSNVLTITDTFRSVPFKSGTISSSGE